MYMVAIRKGTEGYLFWCEVPVVKDSCWNHSEAVVVARGTVESTRVVTKPCSCRARVSR